MAECFDADMRIVENSGVSDAWLRDALSLREDMEIIQKLHDEPNDEDGLSAAQLKALFDKAGLTIQRYINDTLIPQVVASHATETQRNDQEAARTEAETQRVEAERERQSAEEVRATAEVRRVRNEEDRAAAEAARETAEAERRAVSEEVVERAQAAARRAEEVECVKVHDVGAGVFAVYVNPQGYLMLAVDPGQEPPRLELDEEGYLLYHMNA